MSTIWHDKKHRRWIGEISLGTIGGKRQRKRVYGRTKREVEAKLEQLRQEQSRGRDLSAPRQTVAELLDYWIEHVATDQAASSRVAYQRDIDLRITPHLGHIYIDQLQPQDVQTWQNALCRSYSAATVVRTRVVLYSALQQALVWGHVSRNVVALVRGPRRERSEIEPLTEEQARRLLAAMAGHRQEAFFVLALSLGLRRGELLALRWDDVDMDAGTLRIRQGKTPSSKRTLQLPTDLVNVLRQHQEMQDAELRRAGERWVDHGLVFTARHGTPVGEASIFYIFKHALRRAGLPESTRLHDLRHSCASFLLARGANLKVISEILGHSNIVTTANVYAHVDAQTQLDTLADFAGWLHNGYTDEENGAIDRNGTG